MRWQAIQQCVPGPAPWLPVVFAASIHFFVDAVGFAQPGSLDLLALFAQVFDVTILPWQWADGKGSYSLVHFSLHLSRLVA